jgi:Tfp pilus assembly ATPase PilU
VELNKEIGFVKSKQSILNDVLAQANYTLLVSKQETINTIRILELLSKSQAHSNSMEGKDIITFYGSTGSGKSTSVNYFMGIPLELYTNFLGEKVVKIDPEYKGK